MEACFIFKDPEDSAINIHVILSRLSLWRCVKSVTEWIMRNSIAVFGSLFEWEACSQSLLNQNMYSN